jgi:SagB-type dehydrogenase family enzyme
MVTIALCLLAPWLAGCTSTPYVTPETPAAWAFDSIEALPEVGDLDGVTLKRALAARRSVRDVEPTPLTSEQQAALLWAAQGQTADWGGRTAPSAGALYPLEAYLVTADAIRHYVPAAHQAQVRRTAHALTDVAGAVGQPAALDAPALVVITGTPDRLKSKYLLRAGRYTLMEAGHAAQNVLLVSTALGLGSVPIGAFSPTAVASALALPEGEEPLYVIPVGVPGQSP